MYSINYYDCTRNIKACQYGHSKKDLQQTVGPYILVRIEGYGSTITLFIMFITCSLLPKGQKRGKQK